MSISLNSLQNNISNALDYFTPQTSNEATSLSLLFGAAFFSKRAALIGGICYAGYKWYANRQVTPLDLKDKEDIALNLAAFGLTQVEYQTIKEYYSNHKKSLEKLKEPLFINRADNNLPRSLIYIPSGPKKGLHVLLKTHGGIKEIGIGGDNLVTLVLHLDSGKKMVFRNCKDDCSYEPEKELNNILSMNPDFDNLFVTGIAVNYIGPYRSRIGIDDDERELNGPKSFIPREENVPKVGYILDYLEGGDLFDRLIFGQKLSHKQSLSMAIEYAEELAQLHEKTMYVHMDQKPHNVFLTKNGRPRLGDFGFSKSVGEKTMPCGSPDYIPPEILKATLKNQYYRVDTASDVWGLGLMILFLFGKLRSWLRLHERLKFNQAIVNDPTKLDKLLIKIIERIYSSLIKRHPQLDIVVETVLKRCLELHPIKRSTAREIVNTLKAIDKKFEEPIVARHSNVELGIISEPPSAPIAKN